MSVTGSRRLLAAVAFVALSLAAGSAEAQTRAETLRYVTGASVNTLDPNIPGSTREAFAVSLSTYDRLVSIEMIEAVGWKDFPTYFSKCSSLLEPDGAMLRLPPGLLVTEQGGVDRYLARTGNPAADPFDFTGVAWLARATDISTSVSARTFQDVRAASASQASHAYLGYGQNAPAPAMMQLRDPRRSLDENSCPTGEPAGRLTPVKTAPLRSALGATLWRISVIRSCGASFRTRKRTDSGSQTQRNGSITSGATPPITRMMRQS